MLDLPLNVDFTGKVVVITGASGAICGTMAKAFAQAGAKVAALYRNPKKGQPIVDAIRQDGGICNGYTGDVTKQADMIAVHEQVLKDFGPCDILINGAGGNNPGATTDIEFHSEAAPGKKSFLDLTIEGIDGVFMLNFSGTLIPTQIFAQDMVEKKQGCILNISSMNAYIPLTKIPAYSAAKAAISNFTQWTATYFATSGVRCNAIAPGFLVSDQNRSLLFNPDGTPSARAQKILNGTPTHRFVENEELLGATFFLCSEKAASAVNGVVLPIDAGFAAYSGV